MNAPVRKLRLPPLESVWSWPRYVSPHLTDIEEECLEWSASFGAFDPETQRLIHDYGKLSMFLLMVLEMQTESGQVTDGVETCRPTRRNVLRTHAPR